MTDLAGRGALGLKGEKKGNRTRRANPDECAEIRMSARGEECTLKSALCNHDPATTVFCHIRLPGDGMGRKPPDYFGFYGCSACHAAQEARDFTSGSFGFEDLIIALRRTQERLRAKGLLQIGVSD
jgi:hypothetical protein